MRVWVGHSLRQARRAGSVRQMPAPHKKPGSVLLQQYVRAKARARAAVLLLSYQTTAPRARPRRERGSK